MVRVPGAFLFVLMTVSLQAQEPLVRASVDSAEYRIGEWIPVNIEAEMPAGSQILGPAEGDSLGTFEILAVKAFEPEIQGGRLRQAFVVRVTSFEPGETAIPSIGFQVVSGTDSSTRRVLANAVPVTITTVEVEPDAELKDIKPPLEAPWAFEDVLPWLILLAIASILGAAYWYYRKYKQGLKAVSEPARPALPAHEQALLALRELEEKRLWQQGKVKEFYSEVSEIIRRFFESRFHIIALELTTDEILAELKRSPAAQPILKPVNTFLLAADLVKFAKYEPAIAENEEELQMAYAIVRAMIPKPVSVTAPVEASADVR
ncbi:MAG: DUF4381 family protein [Bacteroidota bacterium]